MARDDADLISSYFCAKMEAKGRFERAASSADRHRAAVELDHIRKAERPFDLDIVGEFYACTAAIAGSPWAEHLQVGAELGLTADDCTKLCRGADVATAESGRAAVGGFELGTGPLCGDRPVPCLSSQGWRAGHREAAVNSSHASGFTVVRVCLT
ncbi:hypothetical protein ACWFRB_19120 [Rhodococcus sp. NPDC055112]